MNKILMRATVVLGATLGTLAFGCASDDSSNDDADGGSDGTGSLFGTGGTSANTEQGGSSGIAGAPIVGPAGGAPNDSYPTYSQSCGDGCDGSFCQNMTTGECEGSDLEMPCLGTSSGMYCSKSCLSDADCAGGDRPMSCLVDCEPYPDVAGTCWQSNSADWMSSEMCS